MLNWPSISIRVYPAKFTIRMHFVNHTVALSSSTIYRQLSQITTSVNIRLTHSGPSHQRGEGLLVQNLPNTEPIPKFLRRSLVIIDLILN